MSSEENLDFDVPGSVEELNAIVSNLGNYGLHEQVLNGFADSLLMKLDLTIANDTKEGLEYIACEIIRHFPVGLYYRGTTSMHINSLLNEEDQFSISCRPLTLILQATLIKLGYECELVLSDKDYMSVHTKIKIGSYFVDFVLPEKSNVKMVTISQLLPRIISYPGIIHELPFKSIKENAELLDSLFILNLMDSMRTKHILDSSEFARICIQLFEKYEQFLNLPFLNFAKNMYKISKDILEID